MLSMELFNSYVFLLFVINMKMAKELFDYVQNVHLISDYFIIYRTFQQFTGINIIDSNFYLSNNKSTTVTLISANVNFPKMNVYCISYSKDDGIWPAKHSKANVVEIYKNVPYCLLAVYVIICEHEPTKVSTMAIRINKLQPVQLRVTPADETKRTLTLCMSRMFVFERWQLFLTAMELNRLQKVEMVIAYILSVDPYLYELMQVYEKNGLLKVRPNLELPTIDGLDYNPNIEVEWNNHLADYHDCLYEFRESTEFLGFLDWDDLLFASNYQPIPILLNQLAQTDQTVASFFMPWWYSYLQTLEEMNANNFTLNDFWNNGMIIDQSIFNDSITTPNGKMIIRPKFVIRTTAHEPVYFVKGYKQISLSTKHLFMIHMREEKPFIPKQPLPINSSLFEPNFNRMLTTHNISSTIFDGLPKKTSLLNSFLKCKREVLRMVYDLHQRKQTHVCPNISQCQHEKIVHLCVNNYNLWNIKRNKRNHMFAIMGGNYFEKSICKYIYPVHHFLSNN